MLSTRYRTPSRRARARLILLGITGLVVLQSIYSTSAWLQPAQPAFAQSDTATPTIVAQPNPTATLSEPPLALQSTASAASAAAGEQFSFTTSIVAASDEPRTIELRASIDGQLELLGVSGGSCSSGSAISCKLSVRRGQSATIVATVRIRPNAVVGSRLVYQPLAQDDQDYTAASDQVVVTIVPAQPIPTTSPEPAPHPTHAPDAPAGGASAPVRPKSSTDRPARPAPTAAQVISANAAAPNTSSPAARALPVVPITVLRSSSGTITSDAPAEGAAATDSWLVTAPSMPAPTMALDPVAPALTVPEQPAVEAAPAAAPPAAMAVTSQIVLLPNTVATPLSGGIVAVLLGSALMMHGLRRVRRAAAQLDRQGAALGRLAKLARIQARRRARRGPELW